METAIPQVEYFPDIAEEAALPPDPGRYAGFLRPTAAVISGVIAGVLLVGSVQVGVAFALGEDARDWDVLKWGDHWMWRGVVVGFQKVWTPAFQNLSPRSSLV